MFCVLVFKIYIMMESQRGVRGHDCELRSNLSYQVRTQIGVYEHRQRSGTLTWAFDSFELIIESLWMHVTCTYPLQPSSCLKHVNMYIIHMHVWSLESSVSTLTANIFQHGHQILHQNIEKGNFFVRENTRNSRNSWFHCRITRTLCISVWRESFGSYVTMYITTEEGLGQSV